MKKNRGVLLLTLLLTCALLLHISTQITEKANANVIPLGNYLEVDSPRVNATYYNDSVPLVAVLLVGYEFERGMDQQNLTEVSYSLDGAPYVLANWTKSENLSGVPFQRFVVYNVSETLSGLAIGNHSLTLKATLLWGAVLSRDTVFKVAEVTTPSYFLFNVDAQQMSLIFVCFTAAAVGTGLFVYAKKRKN